MKEKMNSHKDFVALAEEKRIKHEEQIKRMRQQEEAKQEALKIQQQIEAEERVKKMALTDAERMKMMKMKDELERK